jgi:hypothetical protein
MFEEEVGYSPYLGGRDFYSRRVAGLIRQGHSLVHLKDGEVVFKAELGAVTAQVTQVQGVWMNPSHRGLGLSAGYMAAVVLLAQKMAPVTSLYVNDYNSRATGHVRTRGLPAGGDLRYSSLLAGGQSRTGRTGFGIGDGYHIGSFQPGFRTRVVSRELAA